MAKLHVIELTKGQDVIGGIHEYLMDKKWKSGVIVAGVGSIHNVTINNPMTFDLPPELKVITINRPCEVVSFMGEITPKDKAPTGMPCQMKDTPSDYVVHIHMTCSHDDGVVNGGGFRNATVLRALNIYVLEEE